MLKILVASSKGGCGKTTLATNLAAHFAQTGKNTVLVDVDRQGSSYQWCTKRPDTVPGVLGVQGVRRWADKIPADTHRVIVDSPAGIRPAEVEELLEDVDALVVPLLPSTIDLDAAQNFLGELAGMAKIKRHKIPVALVANRLKPWTHASQQALETIKGYGFPLVAQLRDSQGYVILAGLGKSIFDYGSENVRSHQEDWAPLLRWIKKLG